MNGKKKIIGSALAVAAAVAFTAMPTVSSAHHGHGKHVHCYGVNSCKGKSECKTATSSCKGKNSCKGQGYKTMGKKECLKKGGSLRPGGRHGNHDMSKQGEHEM